MPINYGVLKGKVIGSSAGTIENPHYQIYAKAGEERFRVAVNVKSKLSPSELLYYTNEDFQHVVSTLVVELPYGFTSLESKPDGIALDYIRNNLFDHNEMAPLAFDIPGQDNDLNEKIDHYVRRSMESEDGILYAFGEQWGPENKPDKIFGFSPGRGVHDIHMNQGNVGEYKRDDGVYQDGGLLFHFPAENKWIAVFLAFQSQSWHTDDVTGHAINQDPADPPGSVIPKTGTILIVGAVVRPAQTTAGLENVTLLNATDQVISLNEWAIANKAKRKFPLKGEISPGQFLTISIPEGERDFFRNKGDIITLLNADGLKVHGVSYTKQQVKAGWTITF
jgi:uncharacterized protein YukJ